MKQLKLERPEAALQLTLTTTQPMHGWATEGGPQTNCIEEAAADKKAEVES